MQLVTLLDIRIVGIEISVLESRSCFQSKASRNVSGREASNTMIAPCAPWK